MNTNRQTVFHLTSRAAVLLLVGATALWIAVSHQSPTLASQFFQSPLPSPSTPCLTLAQDGYVLGFLGFSTRANGATTLSYQLTANGRHDVSYVAFGTGNWTRLTPADGSQVAGVLGDYRIEWTNEHGKPGFPSIKFEPQFAGYSQGARETFALTVTGFDPAAPMSVQVKAGGDELTFTVRFDNPQCDRTPRPAATPTPTPPITASRPITQVYVLADRLFAPDAPTAATAARAATESDGLPAPVPVQLIADDQLRARVAQIDRTARAQAPVTIQAAQAASGWSQYYATDFESNFLFDGGPCIWDNYDPGQPRWWERDTQRKWSGSYAIWPAPSQRPRPANTRTI